MLDRLVRRFRRAHPNHKRIARGAFWVGLLVLAAKACAAAREVALAWRYGVSGVVDGYQLGLTVSTWLPLIFVAAATAVLVPRLVALRRDRSAYSRFTSELNAYVLLVSIAVVGATLLAAPAVTNLLSRGMPPDVRQSAADMAVQLAPAGGLLIVAGYFSARLQARERYAYSLLEAMPPLAVASALLAFSSAPPMLVLVGGTLAGFTIQALAAAIMAARADQGLGSLAFRGDASRWRPICQALIVLLFGQVLITFATPVDQAFAARLGEGAIAALGYGTRLIGLFTGLVAVVVARALLPVLSSAAVDGEFVLGEIQVRRWSAFLLLCGVLILAVGWPLAPFAVRMLFERGSFTASDTALVTQLVQLGLFQLPFYLASLALVQWFSATGRFNVLLWTAVLALIVKLGANVLLIGPLGLPGLMLATAAMYAASLAAHFFMLRRFHVKLG